MPIGHLLKTVNRFQKNNDIADLMDNEDEDTIEGSPTSKLKYKDFLVQLQDAINKAFIDLSECMKSERTES